MMSVAGFLILASFIVERKTEYVTLALIFSISIERFSAWMLLIYASAIYDAHGLYEVKALCVAHGVTIGLLLVINALVVYKFRKLFDISTD